MSRDTGPYFCAGCGLPWPCPDAVRVQEAIGQHWCETKECWLSTPKHECPRCNPKPEPRP